MLVAMLGIGLLIYLEKLTNSAQDYGLIYVNNFLLTIQKEIDSFSNPSHCLRGNMSSLAVQNHSSNSVPVDLLKRLQPLKEGKGCHIGVSRNLLRLYGDLLKMGLEKETPELQENYIAELRLIDRGKISRYHLPPVVLDLEPIIQRISKKQAEVKTTLHHIFHGEMNAVQAEELEEVVKAIDRLSLQVLGSSFGVNLYRQMIKAGTGACIYAKDEAQRIVGVLFGTILEIDGCKMFYAWTCARQANVPGMNFVENLKTYMEPLNTQGVHYMALNVEVENVSAKALYEKAGFLDYGRYYSAFTSSDVHYMAKVCSAYDQELPTLVEVNEAIITSVKDTLGISQVLLLAFQHTTNKLMNNFLY